MSTRENPLLKFKKRDNYIKQGYQPYGPQGAPLLKSPLSLSQEHIHQSSQNQPRNVYLREQDPEMLHQSKKEQVKETVQPPNPTKNPNIFRLFLEKPEEFSGKSRT